jgi:hypothetical protein
LEFRWVLESTLTKPWVLDLQVDAHIVDYNCRDGEGIWILVGIAKIPGSVVSLNSRERFGYPRRLLRIAEMQGFVMALDTREMGAYVHTHVV